MPPHLKTAEHHYVTRATDDGHPGGRGLAGSSDAAVTVLPGQKANREASPDDEDHTDVQHELEVEVAERHNREDRDVDEIGDQDRPFATRQQHTPILSVYP